MNLISFQRSKYEDDKIEVYNAIFLRCQHVEFAMRKYLQFG